MFDLFKAYEGKKVLVTGHTGFKGSWMCLLLKTVGAQVVGYSLKPNTEPALYDLVKFDEGEIKSYIGDIRDFAKLSGVINNEQPEYVIHMAAQPIVRESYRNPRETYETNVMGTVNLLEAIRNCSSVKSVLNITTDKVYLNVEKDCGYKEEEMLDGFDPYSNSKSCSELVTHSYCKSFFNDKGIPISTARAGNVIGGGDFEKDRIIPDCVRAVLSDSEIFLRNPNSIRPYQHVLEPLYVYLMITAMQEKNHQLQGAYNVGPDPESFMTTGELVEMFGKYWGRGFKWSNSREAVNNMHEANILKLDCSKLKYVFDWNACWGIDEAVKEVVAWTKVFSSKENIRVYMENVIKCFLEQRNIE